MASEYCEHETTVPRLGTTQHTVFKMCSRDWTTWIETSSRHSFGNWRQHVGAQGRKVHENKGTYVIHNVFLTKIVDFLKRFHQSPKTWGGAGYTRQLSQHPWVLLHKPQNSANAFALLGSWLVEMLPQSCLKAVFQLIMTGLVWIGAPIIRRRMACASDMVFSWKQCSNPDTPCVLETEPTAMISLS